MASGIFLKIDGVEGESTDDHHKGWIDVLSLAQSDGRPIPSGEVLRRGPRGGFVIEKRAGTSSPKLYAMCSSGAHIPKAALHLTSNSGSKEIPYTVLNLEQVVIVSMKTAGGSGPASAVDTVSLSYGAIQ